MDHYLVLGNPIEQSRSPFIHQAFAKQTHQQLTYEKQWVALDAFEHTVQTFIAKGGKGANITVPFKEQAFVLCDQLTERAKSAGAVNTLSFKSGKIYGDNTDGAGLVSDLLRNKVNLTGINILILGAGGATKGVIQPLLAQKPLTITIANRTVSKAHAIANKYHQQAIISSSYESLTNKSFDIIINATSASLSKQIPNIPPSIITANTVCYDMVYDKDLTPFLVWAKTIGANKVIDGLGMLVGQAAESFNLWRGVLPDIEATLVSIRTQINEQK